MMPTKPAEAVYFGAALFLALLFSAAAYAQQPPDPTLPVGFANATPGVVLWDQCGGEKQRPCTPSDPAYQNDPLFFTMSGGCDFTLIPSGNTCIPFTRHNPSVPGSYVPQWLQTQQSDQYSRISADLPINLVPIMGTHNSYSNSVDGGSEILSTDQSFTITDQLNLGARFIRLDPVHSINGMAIDCHTSELQASLLKYINILNSDFGGNAPTGASQLCATTINEPAAKSLNGLWSFQRPTYLALEELAAWLANNPGEVVFITINNFYSAGDDAYLDPADLDSLFLHVLGGVLFTPADYASLNSPTVWPTIRQMRALNKRVLIYLSHPSATSPSTWNPNAQDPSTSHWPSTASPYFPSCGDYVNYGVGPGPRNASTSEWIGEDRSLSNALAIASGDGMEAGLMGWEEAAIATQCGYGTISFDFLYSLNSAVNNFYAKLGSVNFTANGNFFSADNGLDERPQWLIWSWLRGTPVAPSGGGPAALTQQSLSGQDLGAQTKLSALPVTSEVMAYRWEQISPSTALRFACAGPHGGSGSFPDPTNMWGYSWNVTTVSDVWANGENECQAEFGTGFHFWRPMSAPENSGLAGAMKALGASQVWLNYNPGATNAFPSQTTLHYNAGHANNGDDIVVAGGFGGPLTATFTPDPNTPNFVTIRQAIPGGNIFHLAANANALANTKTGTYHGTLTITEQHPDLSASSSSQVSVFLNYAANSQFAATPATVDFVSSLTQTVKIDATPGSVAFGFSSKSVPTWLQVSFDQMTTPATMTLVADPTLAPRVGHVGLVLMPTDHNYQPTTVDLTIQVAAVKINANPSVPNPNLAIPVTIDQSATTLPASLFWVVGSSHQVSVPGTYSADGMTFYKFHSWTGVTGTAAVNIVAPTGAPVFTAQYDTRYTLAISSSPANAGTVVANPAADLLGTYLAGTPVTLNASAASGFQFKQFAGASTSQQSPATITMNAPGSVTGVFVPQQSQITFNTNPAGLSVLVDGVSYPTPANFTWTTAETHTVAGPTQNTGPGSRLVFTSWSDNGSSISSRTFSGSATPTTVTLNFGRTEYLVSTQVAPSLSGTVTGAGWYAANTTAALQALPAAGFQFGSFSGGITSSGNPAQFAVTGPAQVTANFTGTTAPLLFASSSGRIDNGDGTVTVPIVLNDYPTGGPAGDAMITGISIVTVPLGAGPPTLINPANNAALFPIAMGTIFPGMSSQSTVNMNWPISATRVTFKVSFSANGGAYQSSITITIFR